MEPTYDGELFPDEPIYVEADEIEAMTYGQHLTRAAILTAKATRDGTLAGREQAELRIALLAEAQVHATLAVAKRDWR